VIVGVGGTSTNDGGAGAMQGLGLRLLDGRGRELAAGPLALHWLSRIDASGVPSTLPAAELVIAADVRSPLLGGAGATAVFGPQKGVNAALAPRIEGGLAQLARMARRDLGVRMDEIEGGGAGGGLAAGLVAACGARVESGAAAVAEAIGLRARIEACDVVVTGEGRLDGQTGRGKSVAFVAALAQELCKPCFAVVGSAASSAAGSAESDVRGLSGVEAARGGYSDVEAMARASELVAAAAERLAGRLAAGR
jgi:glycerate kinase